MPTQKRRTLDRLRDVCGGDAHSTGSRGETALRGGSLKGSMLGHGRKNGDAPDDGSQCRLQNQ
jgi:hypothetical protein